ncbi:hypothetical protein COU19_01435 [Candidatus Kaiserbacteria bacterium CG10_big_fil_rev_8_21_14_0_10_56_12]|uniref:Uncharacterized protein n=1 Tax=Candidatus Kaiserbacteria bacterium CG10_big_fil_rev_8_21_14_0_10_56_12 TaxID=1974611 RepID=A0A2H0UBU5_9BACT|nr:MAG: hypothetical protein COU19_01435 [Candidatus Kaiserbacteria bacterium CG10_big_fil_rev_8_21_14_0_10_56_12]
MNTVVTDASGRQTGVVPMPGTDFAGIKRDIPGSSVQTVGNEQYIQVPKSGTYEVSAVGYASGPTTLTIDTLDSHSTVTASETFTRIPTTYHSTIMLSVVNGSSTAPAVDVTGDGMPDFTVVSSAPGTDPLATLPLSARQNHQLMARLRELVRQLTIHRSNTKQTLKLIDKIEKDVQKDVSLYLRSQERGRSTTLDMPPDQAEAILSMLSELRELI